MLKHAWVSNAMKSYVSRFQQPGNAEEFAFDTINRTCKINTQTRI